MALRTDHIFDGSNVRPFMLDEFRLDATADDLYVGLQLSDEGVRVWPEMLEMAIAHHDSQWLGDALRDSRYWVSHYIQNRATGPVRSSVPVNAPDRIAEGEFGRFYIRGVCREALATGQRVVVTRLRASSRPRPESEALIGSYVDAETLLLDLRGNKGTDTYSGIPGGPNSGLGVMLS